MYSETYSRILWFVIEIHCASCIVMYPDVSWVYLTQRMKYMEAWLVHHLTPPCRQISKPTRHTSTHPVPAHILHILSTYPAYLLRIWTAVPRYTLDPRIPHVSCMYPACILHVSCMYLIGCAKIHTWALYLACLACIHMYLTCCEKIRSLSMYPACILHVSRMYLTH